MSKIAIWSDVDLDGAVSQLAIQWVMKNFNFSREVHLSRAMDLRRQFTTWLLNNKIDEYEAIFFLDLDTTPISDLIDRPNVVIYDHHETHFEQAQLYTKAAVIVKKCNSTAELIYKHNKNKVDFTSDQQYLIALTSDYDSYQLKHEDSKKLNILFWSYPPSTRLAKFTNQFLKGFKRFTLEQEKTINEYQEKVKDAVDNLRLFYGNYRHYTVACTFCEVGHNEIASYIANQYDFEIIILVNIKMESVSFRRHPECDVNLSEVSADLCNGGGHPAASGGKITEKFLEFTKTLSVYDNI